MSFYHFLKEKNLNKGKQAYYERFFHNPGFAVFIAGMVLFSSVLSFVAYSVGYSDRSLQASDREKVLGESVSISREKAFLDTDIYEYSLGRILNEYLEKRASLIYSYSQQNFSQYLKVAEETKGYLLDMKINGYYRDLHLKVVTLIDKEMSYFKALSPDSDLDKYTGDWQDILDTYEWLNW